MVLVACLSVVLASAAPGPATMSDSAPTAMPLHDGEDGDGSDEESDVDGSMVPAASFGFDNGPSTGATPAVSDEGARSASAASETSTADPPTALAATMATGMAVAGPILTLLPAIAALAVRAPVELAFVLGLGVPFVSLVTVIPMAIAATTGRGWDKVGAGIWAPVGAVVGAGVGALVLVGSLTAPEMVLGLGATQGFALPAALWGGVTWGATLGAMMAADVVSPTGEGHEAPTVPLLVGVGVAAAAVGGAVVGTGAVYGLVVAALLGNQSFGVGYLGLGVIMATPLATALPAAMLAAWALTPGPRTFVKVGYGALAGGLVGGAVGGAGGILSGGRVLVRRQSNGLVGASSGFVIGVGVGAGIGAALAGSDDDTHTLGE